MGAEAVLSRREVDRCVLTADFDEVLGLKNLKGGSVQPQPFGRKVDRPVDRRKYNLFQSAVKAVSKVKMVIFFQIGLEP